MTLSRRDLLCTAATLTAGSALRSFAATQAATATVRTAVGTVRGAIENGTRVFRGIPFAEPPVGAFRFRPPVAKKPFTGEYDATRFGAEPFQTETPSIRKSEDCLQLNVWTPAEMPRGKPLPVFVWIHGGGFTGGRAFDPVTDGVAFAREGIVCVTVAYRLGIFGFLNFGPLLGDAYRGSANNALRDLLLALQWVQQHIADFGGDPSRVTIGGESAGAKLCDILMGTPGAAPLFHQVISESGGAERVWPLTNSEAVAKGFAATWKTSTGQDAASMLTAEPAKLIEAQQAFIEVWPQHFPLRCEVDGVLLKQPPIQTIAGGSTRGKRLLLGTNRDESALFLGPHPSRNAAAADLGNMPVERFAPLYEQYTALYPDLTVEQRRIRAVTAEEYWIPSMRVAAAHANNGGETFVYRLDFAESSGRMQGFAYHSLDIGLVWGKPHTDVTNAQAEAGVAKTMHAAWTAFISGKAPEAHDLPAWPKWSATDRQTMLLNTTSRVEAHPQEAEYRLWQGKL